jgi:2-iminobutanoate/2-iminopropanoate deaminase
MEEKRLFNTSKAGITGGPYSQAVIHGGLVYVSGQIAFDPETNKFRAGTIEEESELALENLKIILTEAGSSLDKVLKVSVYLADINDYSSFNEIYRRYFGESLPARVCIQAGALPAGAKVEISAIAYI